MNRLDTCTEVQVKRFKAIKDASFKLSSLNVLVGANNSGKSSIIQGLHFGIGLLQTIQLSGKWTTGNTIVTSINPTELIYSPSEDVYSLGMGGKLQTSAESAITLQFTLASGEQPAVAIRKGRNRNILVTVTMATTAKRLSSLEHPFSVFSPGLAGVSKTEQYVSDGVLLRTIARGDANLVLRNILFRLWGTPEWEGFLFDLREIFPDLDFQVEFKKETDEFITVKAKTGKDQVPLELVGTGVLQATQILSYIHRFSPSMIVLDEPDSHLHPNNQRLLCTLLRRVAEDRSIQILLTTHSRHVVDAITGPTQFLWVRNGIVESVGVDDEIGILLDIGALDIKERSGQPGIKAIILTEDEHTRPLDALLRSSGFVMDKTVLLPYYGVSTIKQLRPLVRMISGVNAEATIVLHRDRDYMTDIEVNEWENSVRSLGVKPVVTTDVDLESHFLRAEHLADVNPGRSEADFDRLINAALASCKDDSIRHYVNGRIEIERSQGNHASIDHGGLAVQATRAVENDLKGLSHGKTVLRRIRRDYQRKYNENLKDTVPGKYAPLKELVLIAEKVFQTQDLP